MARVLLGTDPGPPLTRGLLRIYLESAGHQVQEIGDGEAVLAQAAGAPPDVLVLDTALPNLDGFQVLARLQARTPAPPLPILVISTIPAQLGQRLVESMGAALYLHKPFTFEALRLALETVLPPNGHPASGAAPENGHPANGTAPRNGRATNGTARSNVHPAKPPRRVPRQRSAG